MNQISQSDVKKTYRFYAPIYDFLFGSVLEPGRRVIAREVQDLKPSNLLEIGVGTGLLLPSYPSDCKVYGIDLSEDMLELARVKVEQMPERQISLQLMDAENLQFEDAQFDCVVLPYVLSVTPNPSAIVNEARRVCKPNGKILIVNHFSGSRGWYVLEKLVKNIAEKIGFRSDFSYQDHILCHDWHVERVQTVNIFGLSKVVCIRNQE